MAVVRAQSHQKTDAKKGRYTLLVNADAMSPDAELDPLLEGRVDVALLAVVNVPELFILRKVERSYA